MCALVWEKPGRFEDLAAITDQLLVIAAEHGGVSERRWQRDDPRADADPAEMHMLSWEGNAAFDAFRNDPRVGQLFTDNQDVLASWQSIWVHAR